ncbi:hypothetical protein JFL43_04300 [Viridibacillus sp. YIM B01967]|uniref:Uncharacterized protein n=1 Tax=Viridibacillus soli TaxID=2798301 RepID=A0ABS1H3V4_9BACL|nr:hypothetical protein [Viridibacillus soli]MBK3494089.1 hypothetical protein [Viridibacillus soli]
MTDKELNQLKMMAKMELANCEFFYFCHLLAPDFYADDRQYLIDLCNEMQDFYERMTMYWLSMYLRDMVNHVLP